MNPRCKKQTLKDMLTLPVQHILRYSLYFKGLVTMTAFIFTIRAVWQTYTGPCSPDIPTTRPSHNCSRLSTTLASTFA